IRTDSFERCSTLFLAFSQCADSFLDAPTSRFSRFGLLNREDIPLLVAIGQAVERPPRVPITVECIGKVGRHAYLAWLSIEFNLDIHFVASHYTGKRTVLCADREHIFPAHRCYGAAVGVAVNRDADRRSLTRSEVSDDFLWNTDACGCLAIKLDAGMKFHLFPLSFFSLMKNALSSSLR